MARRTIIETKNNNLKENKMKELKVFIRFIMILWVMVLAGCGTKSMLCSVPEADGSVICKLSEKMNTSPEVISKTLKITNAGALAMGVYEAKEAEEFIDDIIDEIETVRAEGLNITYGDAIDYIQKKYKKLPVKVQVLFAILDPELLSKNIIEIPLNDYDLDLVLRHLRAQKKQVIDIFKTLQV
jgi:hypothetical protein